MRQNACFSIIHVISQMQYTLGTQEIIRNLRYGIYSCIQKFSNSRFPRIFIFQP